MFLNQDFTWETKIQCNYSKQDPTQPPSNDDQDVANESPPEIRDKEKPKIDGVENDPAEAGEKDPPRTVTTGATSAAAVTIKNNLDVQTVTIGILFHYSKNLKQK